MSLGGGSQESDSGSQSKPVLFDFSQILPSYQNKLRKNSFKDLGGNTLNALNNNEGLSPVEQSLMTTRMNENIGNTMNADIGNLRDIYAKSGVRGVVQGSEIGDILQSGVKASGDVSKYVEDANRAEIDKKWARLLQMIGMNPPFAASQSSTSSGSSSQWKVDPINLPW